MTVQRMGAAASATFATGWLATLMLLGVLGAQYAAAETIPQLGTPDWLNLVTQAPIAAALAYALRLNAQRERERDDVRIKLEELHVAANAKRDEAISSLQTEVGKLASAQGELAHAISRLDTTLSIRCGRNDRT
jgi:hypothetical protein